MGIAEDVPRAGMGTRGKDWTGVAREKGPWGRAACGSLLGVFQGDDGYDGPSVHAPHAGAVTHEVVVDGGAVGADLGEKVGAGGEVAGPARACRVRRLVSSALQRGYPGWLCTPHRAAGRLNKEKPPPSPTWMALDRPLSPLLPGGQADLGRLVGHHDAMSESVSIIQVLGMHISFYSDEMLGRRQT